MNKVYKVFTSYAWTNPAHELKVTELCERLMGDGIEVIFDKWDLKPGNDKYLFMEQCVNDPNIDKVLLICNKTYKEKADARTGGVGDETTIISQEVYSNNNQEKFIPVIFEKDDNDDAYVPTYVKSRIYIDLSNDEIYEDGYEQLVRNIYEEPLNRKPARGKRPTWLDESNISLSHENGLIKQIKSNLNNKHKLEFLITDFNEAFIAKLDEYKIEFSENPGAEIENKINEMKPIKDLFIEYISSLLQSNLCIEDIIGDFFENVYNSLSKHEEYEEQYAFILWEMFLISIAYLIRFERFKELHEILSRVYFLRTNSYSQTKQSSFTEFRPYMQYYESFKKQNSDRNLITFEGDLLLSRTKKPIATKENLVIADILLCQLSYIVSPNISYKVHWFPIIYIYNYKNSGNIYYEFCKKFTSKKFCNKILPLFGASNISELKDILEKNKVPDQINYQSAWDSCPSITNYIKIEEIALY